MIIRFFTLISLAISLTASAQRNGQMISIYFPLNQNELDGTAIRTMDSLLKVGILNRDQELKIYGYADYLGSEQHNDSLARDRAQATRDYLLARDFTPNNFKICGGRGTRHTAADTGKNGNLDSRVVQIVILPKPKKIVETNVIDSSYHRKFREWGNDPTGLLDEMIARDSMEPPEHHQLGYFPNDMAALTERKCRKVAFLKAHPARIGNSGYSSIAMEAAMIFALLEEKDSTFYYLNLALDVCKGKSAGCREIYSPNILGFVNFSRYKSSPEWHNFEKRILDYFKTNEHPQNAQLAIQLLRASGADQSVRLWAGAETIDAETSRQVDKESLELIKKVVYKNGFPGISIVGRPAAEAAFLLVQHADGDLKFQEEMLKSMQQLATKNDIANEALAYLTDRIMIATQGKQLYGTQFKTTDRDNGNVELYPIVDAKNVDERRRAIGLCSLAEYLGR